MRGDKSKYTDKQKRKAEHIEAGYEERSTGHKEAERPAWATVNKESGDGNLSGSGRGHLDRQEASSRGGQIGDQSMTAAQRSMAAKKGWETRRANSHATFHGHTRGH